MEDQPLLPQTTTHSLPRIITKKTGELFQFSVVYYFVSLVTGAGYAGWATAKPLSGNITDMPNDLANAWYDNQEAFWEAITNGAMSLLINFVINSYFMPKAGRTMERDDSPPVVFWFAIALSLLASFVAGIQSAWPLLSIVYLAIPFFLISMVGTFITRFPTGISFLRLIRDMSNGDELRRLRAGDLLKGVEIELLSRTPINLDQKNLTIYVTEYLDKIVTFDGANATFTRDPARRYFSFRGDDILIKINPAAYYPKSRYASQIALSFVALPIYLVYINLISGALVRIFGLSIRNPVLKPINFILSALLALPHGSFYMKTFYGIPERIKTYFKHDLKWVGTVGALFFVTAYFLANFISASSVEELILSMVYDPEGINLLRFIPGDVNFNFSVPFIPTSLMGLIGILYGLGINATNATNFVHAMAHKGIENQITYRDRALICLENGDTLHFTPALRSKLDETEIKVASLVSTARAEWRDGARLRERRSNNGNIAANYQALMNP